MDRCHRSSAVLLPILTSAQPGLSSSTHDVRKGGLALT